MIDYNYFVPRNIELHGKQANIGGIFILNPLGQGLLKEKTLPSFYIQRYVASENNGKKYKLVEVKKPEENKLYFVTNHNDLLERYKLSNYKIFLSEDTYCFWNKTDDNLFDIKIEKQTWNHYYEVQKLDGLEQYLLLNKKESVFDI